MNSTQSLYRASRFALLRDLLALLAAVRAIERPLSSPDGFREVLVLVIRLVEKLGLDPSWTDRLRKVLDDDRLFNVVWAIAQYVLGLVDLDDDTAAVNASSDAPVLDAQALVDWLPLVLEIIRLLRELGVRLD
jgi:hypothetical protein